MIHAEQQEGEKDGSDDESESEQEDLNEEAPAIEIQMEHSEQLAAADQIVERADIAEQDAPICSSAVAVPVDFVPEVEKVDEAEKAAEVEKVEEAEDEMVVKDEEESPVPAVMEPEKPVGQLVSCDGTEMEASATFGSSLQPGKEVMEEIVASDGSSLEVDEVAAVTSEPTMAGSAEHDLLASEQPADDDDSSSAKPLIAAAAGSVAAAAAVASTAAGHSK